VVVVVQYVAIDIGKTRSIKHDEGHLCSVATAIALLPSKGKKKKKKLAVAVVAETF
jgi:hypothetical protein